MSSSSFPDHSRCPWDMNHEASLGSGAAPEEDGWGAWLAQVAAAADLCLKPYRHAVRFCNAPPDPEEGDADDLSLLIEARTASGERQPAADLELEIYRSGASLNLMLAFRHQEAWPLLWHGQHPVWMDGASGARCARPDDGAPLEALARRLRSLVSPGPGESQVQSSG